MHFPLWNFGHADKWLSGKTNADLYVAAFAHIVTAFVLFIHQEFRRSETCWSNEILQVRNVKY